MSKPEKLPRLLLEALGIFVIAVAVDFVHLVAMGTVRGYPAGNCSGYLFWGIPPAALGLVPIRAFMLTRSVACTVVAFFAAAIGAGAALYIAGIGGYAAVAIIKQN